MGIMETMGIEGDVKLTWDPDKPKEVEAAEETFKANVKKGMSAYRMYDGGKKGQPLEKFDKTAEKILFLTPLAGG